MTDDDFLQMEQQLKSDLIEFKRACDEKGFDFKERADDLVFDANEE